MSLTRNTVMAVLGALGAAAIALPLGACGRDEPDLGEGRADFVQHCGSCHTLARAGTAGTTGPDLDKAFQTALADGIDRDTVEGIVHRQILHPRTDSVMLPVSKEVTGEAATNVAAYVGYAAARKGEDSAALAAAGLSEAKTGDQIFSAAGCGGCHTFAPAGSDGTIGPNLNDLKTAAGTREPGKSAEEYIRESLTTPDAFLVEGFQNVMPAQTSLSDQQIDALIDYLLQQGGG